MKKFLALNLTLFFGAWGLGAQPLEIVLEPSKEVSAKADGRLGQTEYAVKFTDPRTGIEIFGSADSVNLYLALRSPGSGWLALGLGASGMRGALMMIATQEAPGEWKVVQHQGQALYRHTPVKGPNLIAAAAWQEDSRTCMELVLPLKYAADKAVTAGQATPFIMAYHRNRPALSKHTQRSSGTIVLKR